MSAASVSRTGLPFSQLSVTASISACCSIASATALSTLARPAAEVSPQASLAACAASSAVSTSSGVESATSHIGLAVAGLRLTLYLPAAGGSHLPPMKFSYRGCTETMLPGWPGGTYFMTVPSLLRDLAASPADWPGLPIQTLGTAGLPDRCIRPP